MKSLPRRHLNTVIAAERLRAQDAARRDYLLLDAPNSSPETRAAARLGVARNGFTVWFCSLAQRIYDRPVEGVLLAAKQREQRLLEDPEHIIGWQRRAAQRRIARMHERLTARGLAPGSPEFEQAFRDEREVLASIDPETGELRVKARPTYDRTLGLFENIVRIERIGLRVCASSGRELPEFATEYREAVRDLVNHLESELDRAMRHASARRRALREATGDFQRLLLRRAEAWWAHNNWAKNSRNKKPAPKGWMPNTWGAAELAEFEQELAKLRDLESHVAVRAKLGEADRAFSCRCGIGNRRWAKAMLDPAFHALAWPPSLRKAF